MSVRSTFLKTEEKNTKMTNDFMECRICKEFFDPSSLNKVLEHEHRGLKLLKDDIKGVRIK